MTDAFTKRHDWLRGFSAAAALVGVTLGLAAIIAPTVEGDDGATAREQAVHELNALGYSLRQALADCEPALRAHCGGMPACLYGPGLMVEGSVAAAAPMMPLSALLCTDGIGAGASWHGPYMPRIPIDPWGRTYVVDMRPTADGTRAIILLSAGPDGILQTSAGATATVGDDVAVQLVR